MTSIVPESYAAPGLAVNPAEAAAIRKVAWRLLPFLCLCYIVSYLDRSNIGIASLTMMPDLGMDAAHFGFAAGVFFIGYVLGEIPSNLLQVKFGARRWMARIMISWGLIASAQALVTTADGLYIMRVALGLAEAGFVPGAIFYMAFWFPAAFRARAFSFFVMGIPISMVIGAPLSASILYMDGIWGLSGWQWLFVIEGLPAVILGFLCLKLLTDKPENASWLTAEEKHALISALKRDEGEPIAGDRSPVREALLNPKMWIMSLVGIGLGGGTYAIVFFLPQIISEYGFTNMETGFMTAIPFLVGGIAMYLWGRHSDRTNERRWHVVLPFILAAVSFFVAATADSYIVMITALSFAAIGVMAPTPAFWQFIPIFFRSGVNAALATATITTIANLTGFFQPTVMGYLRMVSGNYSGGLIFAGIICVVAAIVGLMLVPRASQPD